MKRIVVRDFCSGFAMDMPPVECSTFGIHLRESSARREEINSRVDESSLSPAVQISNLNKTFRSGRKALNNIRLQIEPGQMVALIGSSGSGKSTLLRNLAGLTVGDRGSGEVTVLGRRVQRNGVVARDIRKVRSRIGFVFQQFNLVGRLSLLTNVLAGTLGRVPAWRGTLRWFTAAEKKMAMDALAMVGIAEYAAQRASTLSGGQQQRAAIARALVQQAEIILADEPIASLDPRNTRIVMDALLRINKHFGITVICNLHSLDLARGYCDRLIGMASGRIVFDGAPAALTEHIARELYDLEANEVMGAAPAGLPAGASIPALDTAAAA
jgi:phosphonate transport system ATP-binding protein